MAQNLDSRRVLAPARVVATRSQHLSCWGTRLESRFCNKRNLKPILIDVCFSGSYFTLDLRLRDAVGDAVEGAVVNLQPANHT